MSRIVLYRIAILVKRKALGTQCYTLVEFYIAPYNASGAYHYPRSVVNGKVFTYLSAWVYINARFAMC